MNQSSANTASFLHEHGMRRIELTYMPGTTVFTTEDEQLLEKHIQLHDFEYDLLKKTEKLFEAFVLIDKQLAGLKKSLAKIKKMLNDTIALADELSANSYIPKETNLEKIREHNDAIIHELKGYNEQHNMLFKEIKYQQEILNNCINASEEGSGKMYDEYSAVSSVHNEHYLINTIDIVSLDSDLEKFRIIQNNYQERRIFFMDRCDDVVVDYKAFDLETNILYGVWNEFTKRCELMQVLSDLRNSQTASSINLAAPPYLCF